LLPGLGDRLLASEGYSGQLTHEPRNEERPDNLFTPPLGDPGSHGRFDRRAQTHVIGFDPSWLRAGAFLALLGVVAGALALGRSQAQG